MWWPREIPGAYCNCSRRWRGLAKRFRWCTRCRFWTRRFVERAQTLCCEARIASLVAKYRQQKFDWMDYGPPDAGVQLFGARGAAGNERARFGIAVVGTTNLLKKLFAYGHAQIVEIFLVAETAGHSAAFDC